MMASQAMAAVEVVSTACTNCKLMQADNIFEKAILCCSILQSEYSYHGLQAEAAHLWKTGKVVALQRQWRQGPQVSHLLQLRMPSVLT